MNRLGVWSAATCTGALAIMAQGADYDVIIAGGRVIDGTGKPAFVADVAVKDGKVVQVGDLTAATATTRIDARGAWTAGC